MSDLFSHSFQRVIWLLVVSTALLGAAAPPGSGVTGIPATGRRIARSSSSTLSAEVSDLTEGLSTLRHELNNHEAQLVMIEEKIRDCQEGGGDVYGRCQDLQNNFDKQIKKIDVILDRIAPLEGDLHQLKEEATRQGDGLKQIQGRLEALEKNLHQQEETIGFLKSSMSNVLAYLEKKFEYSAATASWKEYRVVKGDSLGKIAQQNHTSVAKLKELNGENEKISVGQLLRIPSAGS